MIPKPFRMSLATGSTMVLVSFLLWGCVAPPASTSPAATTEESAAEASPADNEICVFNIDSANSPHEECTGDSSAAVVVRRTAVCSDIVPFDGYEAYQNADPVKTIGWTFGVNFDGDQQTNLLACLRLYWRDDSQSAYVPVDGGGIVVDTCQIVAKGTDQNPTLANGYASFRGTGGIVCAMNIAEWVSKYLSSSSLPQRYDQKVSTDLDVFAKTDPQQYADFAMVADAEWPEDLMPESAEAEADSESSVLALPILKYIPRSATLPPVALRLQMVEQEVITFDNRCDSELRWGLPSGLQRVWLDYSKQYTGTDYYPRGVRIELPNTGFGRCKVDVAPGPVEWSIGQSDLEIGFDQDNQVSFWGDLHGVLIDPLDSKPPE